MCGRTAKIAEAHDTNGVIAMSTLRNLPVARKFALAFGIVCALCTGLGAYTFFTFRAISTASLDVSTNGFPAVIALSDIRGAMNKLRREDLDLLLCTSQACVEKHSAYRSKAITEYEAAEKKYVPMVSYPGESELHGKFTAALDAYHEASNRASAAVAAGKVDVALNILMADSTVTVRSFAATCSRAVVAACSGGAIMRVRIQPVRADSKIMRIVTKALIQVASPLALEVWWALSKPYLMLS